MAAHQARLTAELVAELAALGSPERAVGERAYLKSTYDHLGVGVPATRSVARAFVRGHRPDHDQLVDLIDELWSGNVYERRLLATLLLLQSWRQFGVTDLAWIESLIRDSRTWALVDTIATGVVAPIVRRDPDGLDVLDRWVTHDDFWVRRSAVLGLRDLMRDGREIDRFVRYADVLLPEREFFIRKALGWIARDTGRRHPGPIDAWVRSNLALMNGVTIREAVKYLPDGPALLEAWRSRPARPSRSEP
jgi:3-methyladenine DNA glycosylase AlkD